MDGKAWRCPECEQRHHSHDSECMYECCEELIFDPPATTDEGGAVSRHSIIECDRLLRAFDGWDPNHCQPLRWTCECGRAWVHICDEAEGCFYSEVAA